MANYEIHIQDVENREDELILHYAERDAIALNWLGGDSKTQPIVGSELNFSLEASDAKDAAFIELFTLDEKRWLVSLRISETQELVWQGYLLPESYSEPYIGGIFYVEVSAVDGLGLLKGVYLLDEFYNQEKTVIELLCEILKQTKIDLELYFSPAIVNINKKDWSKILVDTQLFDYSKDNAYNLLKDLLESMRCQLFQCEGRWYIEGFNKRQLLKVDYEVYNLDANFLRKETIEKTVKQIPFLLAPDVRMVPGIREAVVTYEKQPLALPENIIQENDVPWVVYPGQIDKVWFPERWSYFTNSVPQILTADRDLVYLNPSTDSSLVTTRFIRTKKKFFVRKNGTLKLKMKLKVYGYDSLLDYQKTDAIVNGWSSQQIYEVRIDSKVVATNANSNKQNPAYLEFENGVAEVELTIRPEADGLLDLKFYEPFGSVFNSKYAGTQFKELSLENVPQQDEEVYTIENTTLGSNVSELSLKFADDATLFTKAFYLERQRDVEPIFDPFWFPVLYYKTENSKTYAIVELKAAVLAYQLRFERFKITHVEGFGNSAGQIIEFANAIFNFENGESHAIEVESELADGHLRIIYKRYKEETQPRQKMLEWADAINPISKFRYGQVVGDLEKRIYESPHFTFEVATDAPIKFNDVIKFKYHEKERFFALSNCSWRPDSNTSELIMNEMLYEGGTTELLPPTVDAGPDITLGQYDLGVFLTAVANAPSGFIESVQWTTITGSGAIIDESQNLQTKVEDVKGDFYTFRITVTDSNGLTAFDEVNVSRLINSQLILNEIESDVDFNFEDNLYEKESFTYEVLFSPTLNPNVSVSVLFDILLDLYSNAQQSFIAEALVLIKKNSVEIYKSRIRETDMSADNLKVELEDLQFSINSQDNVTIKVFALSESFNAGNNESISSTARIRLTAATANIETLQITGFPITETANANASS